MITTRLTRIVLPSTCRSLLKGSRSMASISDLQMFPEYASAVGFEKLGQLKKALPMYERVQEVIDASMGAASPLSLHVSCQIANTLRWDGKFDEAIKVLEKKANNSSVADAVVCKQLIATNYLLKGDSARAMEVADSAVALCEAHENTDSVGIAYFSSSYSLLGLSHLVGGDIHQAETFLQLAARWAQTPLTQLVALSNLGTACLSDLGQSDPSFDVLGQREARFLADQYKPLSATADNAPALLKDATSYWEESLRDAQKTAVVTSAAAMCGPGADDQLGMTGLGSKVLSVESKTAKKKEEEKDASTGKAQLLEERLADVEYAVAYASLLCNLAEVSDALGEGVKRDEYTASALKALETHGDNARSHPTLGRVLSVAANAHFYATQAVSAEGLFRSATDRLKSPYALHDPRFLQEAAVTGGSYGKMLKKWDKREAAGEAMIREATTALGQLESRGVKRLNSFVQFPV